MRRRGNNAGRPRVLSPEHDRRIYDDYKRGISRNRLALLYAVSTATVDGAIRRQECGETKLSDFVLSEASGGVV